MVLEVCMNYLVRFSERVKRMLIDHTFKDPFRECGGFLYGNLDISSDVTICDVNDIYYEDKLGTDHDFKFYYAYIIRALAKENRDGFENLIGTYHSHGQHPAFLSSVDHDELQKAFGSDKITVVYSPKYSQMIGEFLDKDGISHRVKILTKQ